MAQLPNVRAAAITPPAPFSIKRGATARQMLAVDVRPGYHINSNQPKDEFIIPLKLTWNDGPLSVKDVLYPKAEDLRVGDQTLSVVTGRFEIQTDFMAQANAPVGAATMTGKLRYQACNDQMCLRPVTSDIQLPVVVK